MARGLHGDGHAVRQRVAQLVRAEASGGARREQEPDDLQVCLDFAGRRRRSARSGFAAQHGSFTPWRTAVISARIATAISGGVLRADVQADRAAQARDLVGRDVEFLQALAARVVVLLRADGADVERRRLQRLHQREVVELRIVRQRDHARCGRRGCSSRTTSSGMPRSIGTPGRSQPAAYSSRGSITITW